MLISPFQVLECDAMKTRWWLLLLVSVSALAWFMGHRSSSSPERTATLQQLAAAPVADRSAAGGNNGPSRKRWAERIGSADDSGLPDLMREIPAKDRGAVLEAWLASSALPILSAQRFRLGPLLPPVAARSATGATATRCELAASSAGEDERCPLNHANPETDTRRRSHQRVLIAAHSSTWNG